jgi:SagB-type dehydrogenase family enzyme
MASEQRTRRTLLALFALAVVSIVVDAVLDPFGTDREDQAGEPTARDTVSLPARLADSGVTVGTAIENRRSRREYGSRPLDRRELATLLWAAQGITEAGRRYRAAPSAGARYPLELSVVVGADGVDDLAPGVYHYRPERGELDRRKRGDVQADLQAAALGQDAVGDAAAVVVVTAVDDRTTARYGARGRERYVPMEAGHAAENVYLQAEALDLATVSIGAFRDRRVRDVVGASDAERPLYLLPVGPRR